MWFFNSQKKIEERKAEIAKELFDCYGKNIMVEFVSDNLHINTTFSQVEYNDLYVAANYHAKLVLKRDVYKKISEFSVSHLKALALAAKNILGDVYVNTNNQLKLNTETLREYKDNQKYSKQFLISEKEIYCLNYDKNVNDNPQKLSANVLAIMSIIRNSDRYDNLFEFFKDIADINSKRNHIWNGFQEGILESEPLEDDELTMILMREYEV